MSFFSNAVKLIKRKNQNEKEDQVAFNNMELDFSIRNYAQESFSVLIIRPISNYFMKFMRISSFIITGGVLGVLLSIITFCIFLQFGSVESKLISFFVDNRINNLFPDADFLVKSAKITWNTEKHLPEISLKRLKLDDLVIPSVSIFPNILESVKQQKFITDSISIVNPKIHLKFSDDFKSVHFDPNFEKNGAKKSLNEPISVLSGFKKLLNDFGDLKIINADVSIEENGVVWNLNNVYGHYVIGDKLPNALSFKIKLPGQNYFSSVNVVRTALGDTDKYIINMDSFNPKGLREILLKRNSPINNPIINSILENNLPVSGLIHFDNKSGKITKGDFDLIGGAGSIIIPAKNTISLNLGKAIDHGNLSGTFSENEIDINSLRISYEDSDIQLTGITIPMAEYHLMDIANIDGTLSLTNVGISEMASLLPENFSKSIIPSFKNYLPGFKLGLFKVDLKGAIPFGKRNLEAPLQVGNGVFKLSDAKIPLGKSLIYDVEATGSITDDGFDIKLAKARLNNTIINSGEFFISGQDNSWIGTINADVSVKEVEKYASDISEKLSHVQINKLNIADSANIDMKLVKIEGDNLANKELPFRIVEGSGILKSKNNAKELKFSWNEKELNLSGEANEGTNDVILSLEENFEKREGVAEFKFKSSSEFLKSLLPDLEKICSGNYALKLNMGWKDNVTQYDLDMDLKNAAITLPIVGDMKLKHTAGNLKAKVLAKDNVLDVYDLILDTAENKMAGNIVVDKNTGYLYKCSFNEFLVGGNDSKINIIRNNQDRISVSVIGKKFNTNILLGLLKTFSGTETISCYLNLDEILISDIYSVKNVKGSLDLQNGKIVKGACYGVIAKDTTLALSAQPNPVENDSIVSLSASNAGEFLKYFKVTDGINGGTINLVAKSSVISDKSMSGAYEIADFVMKNDQLTRLISFSSMNGMANPETYTVGFNFCLGSFVFADNLIKIENGKAVGPTVGISYTGSYDRLEDKLDISGYSLLMSSILSSKGTNGAYAAPYKVIGSFGKPVLSVRPLQFISDSAITEIFGNLIPVMPMMMENLAIGPTSQQDKDPFANNAFDNLVQPTEKKVVEKTPAKATSEQKYGVRINRGKKTK